jgi:hypothetical protein
MHTVNLAARLPGNDRRSAQMARLASKSRTTPKERLIEKKKLDAVNERLDIIRKALSILPESEADQIYQDILSKKPAEIIKVSQPYISKSYSLKLIDSRMISDPQKIPSLRVPLAVAKGNEGKFRQSADGFSTRNQPNKPRIENVTESSFNQLSKSMNAEIMSPEEMKLKQYVNNFYALNEKLYQLHKVDQVKVHKIKERLPVRISAKTQMKLNELERKNKLQQFRDSASKVNLGFHMMYDADLYEDQRSFNSKGQSSNQLGDSKGFSDKSSFRTSHYKTLKQTSSQPEDDYNYDKNYNFYVQLNTGISRHYKKDKDKYKTGVYLGRTKEAGEELAQIKNSLKPFYPALPMSNLSIVREFYQVFKEKGSKLIHKQGALKDVNNTSPESPTNTLQIGNVN